MKDLIGFFLHISEEGPPPPPPPRMCKIGLAGEALYYYTTILYSTGLKVVVNTVRRLSNNFRGGGGQQGKTLAGEGEATVLLFYDPSIVCVAHCHCFQLGPY